MRLDPGFDFRSDTPNKPGSDPDKDSPTLRRYHQVLWSKRLPSGEVFDLQPARGSYLLHESRLGRFQLSSDAAMPSFRKSLPNFRAQLPEGEAERFNHLGYTIGGMMLWPSTRHQGKQTINGAKGFNRSIRDRLDLTIECVRRFYFGQRSPLQPVLERYASFFTLFRDFPSYVEFFLLQDLVTDRETVRFFHPFDDFKTPALPGDFESYRSYLELAMAFIEARNRRIDALALEVPSE